MAPYSPATETHTDTGLAVQTATAVARGAMFILVGDGRARLTVSRTAVLCARVGSQGGTECNTSIGSENA